MSLNNSLKIVLLILIISIKSLFAQNENTAKVSLNSPYNTIFTHLYFLHQENYNPQKSALTIYGDYTLKQKEAIAIKIKKVLDGKALYIDMELLPTANSYIDTTTQKNIYYLSSKEKLIYLERIDTSWYYSKTTIREIDKLYKEVFPFWLVYLDKIIPDKTSSKTILGVKLWQYIAVVILLFLSILFFIISKKFIVLIIKRIIFPIFKAKLPDQELLFVIAKAISLLLTFYLIGKIIPSIQFPLRHAVYIILANKILVIFFTAYLISNTLKILLYYLEKAFEETDTKLDNQLLPILKKIVKLVIYFTAIIYVLQELDINITALLAGLSVGGLALALASKDTIQNVIGSVNIFLDRPFEIGDYIVLSDTEGTVEEVGLRATRIRTQNQSLAYIPNGNLSNMTIDNYGLRVYRRWKTSFGLDYNTSPQKIELFIKEVNAILNKHDKTLNEKTMVYFNNLGASTLDIYISVFFDVKSLEDDLACKQNILLNILKMTNKQQIEFAFPTQTIYRK